MIGLYGNKIGMTQIFDDVGTLIPVTIIKIDHNIVTAKKKSDRDGYDSTVLGVGQVSKKRVTKAHIGQFPEKVDLKKRLFEVKGLEDKQIGETLDIKLFEEATFVDVTGTTKGRGTQGVMKRHGMHGGPARHGSKFHRSIGSVGQGGTPAKFRKGSKMAGRMGAAKKTVQNLRVVEVDIEKNLLVVRGAVPGPNGAAVFVKNALKK